MLNLSSVVAGPQVPAAESRNLERAGKGGAKESIAGIHATSTCLFYTPGKAGSKVGRRQPGVEREQPLDSCLLFFVYSKLIKRKDEKYWEQEEKKNVK